MLDVVKKVLFGLLASKKVQSVAIGAIAVLLVKFSVGNQELANELAQGIFTIVMVLVGAYGLTDLGKGDVVQPKNLGEAMKSAFLGLLSSKKFYTALVGAVAFVLIKFLKVHEQVASDISNTVLAVVSTLLGAQGLADFGKERDKAQVEEKKADAPPTNNAQV